MSNERIESIEHELIKLAGQPAYERGLAYFQDGRVLSMTVRDARVSARVAGTRDYDVSLQITPRGLDGSCDCPASEGFDFCKHCVAVALANASRDSAMRNDGGTTRRARIEAYLAGLPGNELTEIILGALDAAPDLESGLALRADVAAGQVDAKQLKKAITAATPLRDIWQYREVTAYFARASAAINDVAAIASALPPRDLLQVVLHGLKRLSRLLERVDDSGGRRFELQTTLQQLHAVALLGLDWTPEERAIHLLDLALDDPWDTFDTNLAPYADALGAAGRAALYREAQSRFEALPALPFGAGYDAHVPYLRLQSLLEEQARAANDVPALIDIARRTCTGATDCYRIAALMLENDDTDKALEWLDKGDESTSPRLRDVALRVRVHSARSEWQAAAEAQRQTFRASLKIDDYRRLLELGANAGAADACQADAQAMLDTALGGAPWQQQEAALTLAQIRIAGGDAGAAAKLVLEYVRDSAALLQAASWFQEQPAAASAMIVNAAETCIARKNKPAYREAASMLIRHRAVFDAAGGDAFAACIETLRDRHRQKRSFLAQLDSALHKANRLT